MRYRTIFIILFIINLFIVFIAIPTNYYRRFIYTYGYKMFPHSTQTISSNDTLNGKKWVFCGDSFSCDAGSASVNFFELSRYFLRDGIYAGEPCTYPYIIGNRNNMRIVSLAQGGRTIAETSDPNFNNSFSKNYYNRIDKDADIITLYFGINDSHHSPVINEGYSEDGEDKSGSIRIGEVTDTTKMTFCGAYNFVIKYIKDNHPKAKLGIIVSNGCDSDEYRIKTIEIANRWDIPYIDLNGDDHTPPMIRTSNPKYEGIKDSLTRVYAVNYKRGNTHPNYKAHIYQSDYIEDFLVGLFR